MRARRRKLVFVNCPNSDKARWESMFFGLFFSLLPAVYERSLARCSTSSTFIAVLRAALRWSPSKSYIAEP